MSSSRTTTAKCQSNQRASLLDQNENSSNESLTSHQLGELADSIGDAVSRPAARPLSRVEKEWEKFFADGFVTWTLIFGLCIGFLFLRDMELGAELAFTEEESAKLAPAAARIATKHIPSPRIRKLITEGNDYGTVLLVMVAYFARVGEAFKEKGVNFGGTRKPVKQEALRQTSGRADQNGHRPAAAGGTSQSLGLPGLTPFGAYAPN